MRRRIALIVAFIVAPAASSAEMAQESRSSALFPKCTAFRLEVVLGRITAVPLHRGPIRIVKPPEENHGQRETLLVNHEGPAPLVRYEFSDGQRSLTVEIKDFNEVHLVSEKLHAGAFHRLDFRQPAQGKIRLVVENSSTPREYSAASLWHLMLAEPRLCEATLLPVLETLRPSWQLSDLADRLEIELFEMPTEGPRLTRSYVWQLVEQLGAPQFGRRQKADSALRELGPAVLPFLELLDVSALDNEQRGRIRSIRESVTTAAPDSPQRAALWMAHDEQTWLALLRHSDADRRHLAAIHLMAMRPDMIDFDPYGDESSRQAQLAQLRLKFGY